MQLFFLLIRVFFQRFCICSYRIRHQVYPNHLSLHRPNRRDCRGRRGRCFPCPSKRKGSLGQGAVYDSYDFKHGEYIITGSADNQVCRPCYFITYYLPLIFYVFAERVHILNLDLFAVIEYRGARPHTVNLVRVHSERVQHVRVAVMVIKRLHYKIEASVL